MIRMRADFRLPLRNNADNHQMPVSAHWHPVVPTHAPRAGDNVLAALVAGQAVALWRSAAGQVQAWADRCPHRGVALSLGRVQGDRLACAYHGWEYAAGSGRCVAIPAMPDRPVPGKVCVKTFAALERQGMVWVNLGPDAAADAPPSDSPAPAFFLRTLGIHAATGRLDSALAALGYLHEAPRQWSGTLDGHAVRLFTLAAGADQHLLHLACDTEPSRPALPALFGAIRLLRSAIETAATSV